MNPASNRNPRSGKGSGQSLHSPQVEDSRDEGRLCAVCRSTDASREFDALGLKRGDPHFRLLRCRHCGYGWTDPQVPDSEIGGWYPPVYYGKDNVRFNPLFEYFVRVFCRRRARVIARHAQPGPILDVGCGRGLLLKFLRDLRFKPFGTELSPNGAWHAQHKLNIDVHVGDFQNAPYAAGQFHSIIFWHSLEHFRRPEAALRQARRILAPGGLLVIAVPNSDSLQARWFGPNWFHLDIPRHYCHFGLDSLRKFLSDAGFQIVEENHFSLEQNPYGWLQSFYNTLGFEFNFLYSFLKNQTSKTVHIRHHPVQALLTLSSLPILLPLSLLLTFFEAALHRGGTIEVYAEFR